VKIRVRVSTSRIAGQGLFAGQDIKKGTKIIQYIGEKIIREESERRLAAGSVYIFGLNERYAIDGNTPKNTAGVSKNARQRAFLVPGIWASLPSLILNTLAH
jgi:hypothetical protein